MGESVFFFVLKSFSIFSECFRICDGISTEWELGSVIKFVCVRLERYLSQGCLQKFEAPARNPKWGPNI